MDVELQPLPQKDPPSECRSFGSSYRACSQPRKISRGILIDSSAKFSSQNADKGVHQPEENLISTKADPLEVGERIGAINSTDSGKRPRSVGHGPIPPVPIGPSHREIPGSFVVHDSTESNCNENSLGQLKSMAAARKDANTTGIGKPSLANSKEVVIEDTAKEAENRSRETLRVKLWEILGTVASPNQHLSACDLKDGSKDMEPPQANNGERNSALKSKQNSDTIESDSKFLDDTVVRPKTYSLRKKRVPFGLRTNRSRKAQSNCYEEADGKKIARFRQGFSERISNGIRGSSLKKKKCEKQDSGQACKTIYPDQGNQAENQQRVKSQRKVTPPCKRSFSHGNGGGKYKEFLSERKIEFEAKSVPLQRDSHGSPRRNLSQKLRSVIESPKLNENVEIIEDVDFSFLKSVTNKKVDAMSPAFEMRTPTKMSSPVLSPTETKTPSEKLSDDSPPKHFEMRTPTKMPSPVLSPTEIKTPSEKFSDDSPPKSAAVVEDDCDSEGIMADQKGILCFKSWLDCKSKFPQSNYQMYSSDDAGENEDAPTLEVEEPGTWKMKSDSDTSEEDSHSKGCTEPEFHFLRTGNTEKLSNMLHLNKKRRYLEGSKISGFSPTFSSRKGIGVEGFRNFEQHTDLKQDHGLPREIALFMLTLKRFKSKMNSVATERSAEILKSVTENIHSHLKNVEYQMQVDAGKLVNQGKSKRKRLEVKYQELQGNLKAIHERFKEEANQHLQLCKTTVEDLESQQMELKEKQRASSKNLLLQAEAAIETELRDAQRKIDMIQDSVRQKMLQLKNVVADSLREGTFS